jgi:hypothetical protein
MPKIIEKKLIEAFKDKPSFDRKELFEFFRHYEPDLKESTFGWRIYDLKNKNIIKPVKKGIYTISDKPAFAHVLTKELSKLAITISNNFEGLRYCIWDTAWINEFARHQTNKSIIIIETEKEFVESLYYYLKDHFSYDFYLSPDEKDIKYYIAESKYPVIIKKIITRSPTQTIHKKSASITVPLIEKILIDIYAEDKLFYYFKGSELIHIYDHVINSYMINFTTLLGYAGRREKKQEIKEFLKTNLQLNKQVIE